MKSRGTFLVVTLMLIVSVAFSEVSESYESVDYYNGTSFPPPYDLASTSPMYANGNLTESPDGYSPKGIVDDSEEQNLQTQATTTSATTTQVPLSTFPPETETISPQTRPPLRTTTAKPLPTAPSSSANSTFPPGPGFTTVAGDDLDESGKGNGGGNYGGAPQNPIPAGPSAGSPIQDGLPGAPSPDGSKAPTPGVPGPDGPSVCLCAAICLTQTPGPQAPPGNGPCVSLCACVGASTQSGAPAPPSKDVPGPPQPPGPPVHDLPGAQVGADTAQGAVQDGTAVAASQAPPPPQQNS